jgi:superfamily I DNA/RNA helicase
MKLNPEQIQAINAGPGHWLVLATAGSGKTSVLVERAKRLLYAGEPYNEVLALTFTNAAAEEMGKRIGLSISKSDRGGFRTFHSFGLKLILAEQEHLPFKLAENPFAFMNGTKVLKQVIKARYGKQLPKKEQEALRSFISRMKRSSVKLPDTFEAEEIPTHLISKWDGVYRAYIREMESQGQIDFEDMLCLALGLLEQDEIRKRWSYKHVLADEIQDTDHIQWRMLQLITQRDGNLFAVGDGNQSIFRFRNANPENLDRFKEWFPGGQVLILPQNYRSTQNIVSFAKKTAPIKNELTENMRTANELGAEIEILSFTGNEDEAESILDIAQGLDGKTAILARTNQQIGLIETLAYANSIRFHLLGKSGFWKTSEIKNLMSLIAVALGTLEPTNYFQKAVTHLRGYINKLSAPEALREIILKANLKEFYTNEDYDEADNFALGNLNTAVQIAQRFVTIKEFATFANKASHASRKSAHSLALGTVHAAKGLEWQNVIIIGVQEGKMPHEKGDLEEEKCIFHVAVTRPAKRLFISYSGERSRFLEDEI